MDDGDGDYDSFTTIGNIIDIYAICSFPFQRPGNKLTMLPPLWLAPCPSLNRWLKKMNDAEVDDADSMLMFLHVVSTTSLNLNLLAVT